MLGSLKGPVIEDNQQTEEQELRGLKRAGSSLEEPQVKKKRKIQLTGTDYLKNNLFSLFQNILESIYLQPYSGRKSDLKDGFIERETRGAMHVSRVAAYIYILFHKLKEMFPHYHESCLSTLKKDLSLEESQILLLTMFTGLHLDSSREDDFVLTGLGCSNGAKNTEAFLISHDIEKSVAQIFATAANFMRVPEDYLRKLIYLADYLDTMSSVKKFKLQGIYDAIKDIPEYVPERHNQEIIELAKQIFSFIQQQRDMRFGCKIISTYDDKPIAQSQPCYSLKAKLKFEQSDNVFAAILIELKKIPYFNNYLQHLNPPDVVLGSMPLVYNPYIHATSSLVLEGLRKTGLHLCSPIDMIRFYGVTSEGGDIRIGHITPEEDCKTCFARLRSEKTPVNSSRFTLDRILEIFSKISIMSDDYLIDELRKNIASAPSQLFANINHILIYLARAKQRGIDVKNKIFGGEANADNFIRQLKAYINLYYLISFLNKYIFPNFDIIENNYKFNKKDITAVLFAEFTFEKMAKKLYQSGIDLKSVSENPSQIEFQKILNLLELPEKSRVFGREVNLRVTQLFTLIPPREYPKDPYPMAQNIKGLAQYLKSGKSVDTWGLYELEFNFYTPFALLLLNNSPPDYFARLANKLKPRIEALEDRGRLIADLINTDVRDVNIKNHSPFPIVFIHEHSEKMGLEDPSLQEYRATEALALGKDIRTIASDTPEHLIEIRKFLDSQGLKSRVHLVLFDELKKSKVSGAVPSSRYTHIDGMPKLQWLTAKVVR